MSDLTATAGGPTAPEARIQSLDVVRGFALLGILLMNIVAMGSPFAAYFNPAALGPPSQADLTTWIVTQTFFEGSMRTLFSMLFGAGFLLLLERLDARGLGLDAAKIYARRVMWLLLFGIVDIVVLAWGGDILFTYGLAALLLLPFWKSSLRSLVIWTVVVFAATSLFAFGAGPKFVKMKSSWAEAVAVEAAGGELTEEQEEAKRTWREESDFWTLDDERRAEIDERYAEGWSAVAAYNAGDMFAAPFGFLLLSSVLDALAGMLLGMVAYRIGLLQGRWSVRNTALLVAGAFAVGLPINAYETWLIYASGFTLEGFADHLRTYNLGRVSLALGWLGVALLVCKAPWLGLVRGALGAVGRMALTNYLAHSLIALIVFVVLGYFGQFSRAELYLVVLGMWAFNIAFSLLWLRAFTMGPVEWLWRAGTYGYWSNITKSAKPATA
jgi:uncharacterized protein